MADQQRARVGDAAVEVLPGFLVEEDGGGFFEAVEGGGGEGVGGFVGVDEEGEGAVLGFDLGVGDAGLEVEDGVAGGGLAARWVGYAQVENGLTRRVGRP